jgi:hypothetical protein
VRRIVRATGARQAAGGRHQKKYAGEEGAELLGAHEVIVAVSARRGWLIASEPEGVESLRKGVDLAPLAALRLVVFIERSPSSAS